MSLGSTRKPIGVIHAGPIHTLHKPDGSLAIDLYWYEPDYSGDQKLFKPKNGWAKTEQHRRWAMGRINRLPFAHELENIVGRYVIALDNPNLDVAFLQMWAILEKITDTVGGKYDETIERATWVFSDRSVARDLLEHLRVRRNRYVHAGRSADDREQPVYMIKGFVEPHILRLIRNDFQVASLREYGEFLCLPRDTTLLEARRAQLQRVIRMNKKKPSET
jgi:hypothetical protein